MAIVSIHQPQYLPWLGFLDKIARSDIFVFLDDVPYSKNYFYNRNRIKTANGWIWLTIPVLFKGKYGELIKDIQIDNQTNWREKHWKSIMLAYKKAPYFKRYQPYLEAFYSREWTLLSDVSCASVQLMHDLFGMRTRMMKSSNLGAQGMKEERLIDICRKTGATVYISGPDGKNYVTTETWMQANIEINFQEFRHPKYSQLFGEFVPQMAALDMLLNYGGEEGLALLLSDEGEKAELTLK